MDELIIRYKDFSGDITERKISDIETDGSEAIDAYCHSRNARRTFKIANIVFAADPDTGELVTNIWKAIGLSQAADGRERIDSLLADLLNSIKAIKFFALLVRGFAKRERAHILNFIRQNAVVSEYTDAEIEEWLQGLWCADIYKYRDGDTGEYEALLQSIPDSQRRICRVTALAIAAGSKRRLIAPEVLERINNDFGI